MWQSVGVKVMWETSGSVKRLCSSQDVMKVQKQNWLKAECGPVFEVSPSHLHSSENGSCHADLLPLPPPPLSLPLSPCLQCFSPSVAPLSMWVCLGPAGEALSVNSGARTGPRGPDLWMPTLWEPFFLFTPLSLLECLSSEVRNTHTHARIFSLSLPNTHAHTSTHTSNFTHKLSESCGDEKPAFCVWTLSPWTHILRAFLLHQSLPSSPSN